MKRVIVLGGYGNFGKRIVENLATIEGIVVTVAGRELGKAQALLNDIKRGAAAQLEAIELNYLADDFTTNLCRLKPFIVIHTCGPFQGQDYRVPKACAAIGAHYIDLADCRRFVCDITQLDSLAKESEVMLVSGASSVPGLSSAVIDYYQARFSQIDAIDIAIAPGNQAERGEATVRAILSYTGHPFSTLAQGRWTDRFGWMNMRRVDFGDIVGKRWLANVDVPDLELFPHRYDVKQQVSFQAGLELPILHLSMGFMAYLTKIGLVKNWSPMTKAIVKMSNLVLPLGSDKGAMRVMINGVDRDGHPASVTWTLYAPNGIGPYIPTLSAIIVARKLLIDNNSVSKQNSGAMACINLLTLDDFEPYFLALGIYQGASIG